MKTLLTFLLALALLAPSPALAQMQMPSGPAGSASVDGTAIAPTTVTATSTVSGTGEIRVTGTAGTARYLKYQSAGVDAAYIALGSDNATLFFSQPAGGTYSFTTGSTTSTIGASGASFAVPVVVTGNVSATTSILSSGATFGVGYTTGAGGAVTQITSRTTSVTLNKMCGAITLFSTTTTAGQVTTFTVNDSGIVAADVIIVDQKTGTGIYIPTVTAIGAGTFNLSVYTPAAVGSAEAPVMQFCAFKGANS